MAARAPPHQGTTPISPGRPAAHGPLTRAAAPVPGKQVSRGLTKEKTLPLNRRTSYGRTRWVAVAKSASECGWAA